MENKYKCCCPPGSKRIINAGCKLHGVKSTYGEHNAEYKESTEMGNNLKNNKKKGGD